MIPPNKGIVKNELGNIELGNDTVYQLYNLKKDIGQQFNIAKKHPDTLKIMIHSFEEIRGKNY